MIKSKQKPRIRWCHTRKLWRFKRDPGRHGNSYRNLITCPRCDRQEWRGATAKICSICAHEDSKKITKIRSPGIAAVASAIRSGVLPRLNPKDLRGPKVKIFCTDCGAYAQDYDHRSYAKPLEVDPVCHSCNIKRGPAIEVAHLVKRRYKNMTVRKCVDRLG